MNDKQKIEDTDLSVKRGERILYAYQSDKGQIKDVFGELRYMGADNCYKYDKESRKRTDEVEALKLHLGSAKLGKQRGHPA